MNQTRSTASKRNGGNSMEQKQLQALKKQNEKLAQFVVRVSKFYEGADPEMDKEMQILRGHLSGQPNFTLATVSMGKLNSMLMQQSKSIKQQNSETVGKLESAVKKLQGSAIVAEDVKSEVARFLSTLNNNARSVFASLPQFEKAMELYQQALDNASKMRRARLANEAQPAQNELVQSNKQDADSTAQIRQSDRLHTQITSELQELIEQFYNNNKNDKQLAEIRKKLLDGINQDELLECCLILIRFIIRDVIAEAGVAEKFVNGMHSSLVKLNVSVSDSMEESKQRNEFKSENMQSMRSHISDMGTMVTETEDVESLKQQAGEYLEKMSSTLHAREQSDKEEELKLMKLLGSMQSQLSNLEKQTRQYKKRLLEQRVETHTDPLTKVANRIAYNERIETEFERWKRHQAPLCVAIVDVDHFKNINDKYGHAAGDKTLQVIAKNIKSCLRSTDFMARWGGEEFIILFPDTSVDDLGTPLEQIRLKLERLPFKFKSEKVTITASMGGTAFKAGDTVDKVFERADKNLYDAKNGGRNQVVISRD